MELTDFIGAAIRLYCHGPTVLALGSMASRKIDSGQDLSDEDYFRYRTFMGHLKLAVESGNN